MSMAPIAGEQQWCWSVALTARVKCEPQTKFLLWPSSSTETVARRRTDLEMSAKETAEDQNFAGLVGCGEGSRRSRRRRQVSSSPPALMRTPARIGGQFAKRTGGHGACRQNIAGDGELLPPAKRTDYYFTRVAATWGAVAVRAFHAPVHDASSTFSWRANL